MAPPCRRSGPAWSIDTADGENNAQTPYSIPGFNLPAGLFCFRFSRFPLPSGRFELEPRNHFRSGRSSGRESHLHPPGDLRKLEWFGPVSFTHPASPGERPDHLLHRRPGLGQLGVPGSEGGDADQEPDGPAPRHPDAGGLHRGQRAGKQPDRRQLPAVLRCHLWDLCHTRASSCRCAATTTSSRPVHTPTTTAPASQRWRLLYLLWR